MKRLTEMVQTRRADRHQARFASMSYKDLEAEMVQLAVKRGYPGDPTQLIFASASAWLDEQNRALLAKIPEAERARLLAKFPSLRGS